MVAFSQATSNKRFPSNVFLLISAPILISAIRIFIGTSSIWARDESRVLPNDPLSSPSTNCTSKIRHQKAVIYGIDASDTVKAIGVEID